MNQTKETTEFKPVQVISGGGMGGNDLIDLELNITTNKTSFNLYEYINFDLVLTNFGTDEATSITVSVPFPKEWLMLQKVNLWEFTINT
ncbi:MAG: hypothetical protein R2784_07015 [Saprospiraceae bacterium]